MFLIPRRMLAAFALAPIVGGCTESLAQRIAKDPYLPTMMRDPLYLWNPPGSVKRSEGIRPKSDSQFASGNSSSSINIVFIVLDGQDPDQLLQEGLRIQAAAGYVDGVREISPGLKILSNVVRLEDNQVGVVLLAPV